MASGASSHGAPYDGGVDETMEGGAANYGSDDNSKSPLDRLGFAKFLSGEKKTRDGQPAKRRGPKPDSKPALTRRQELNRQAQRTHRERKEMYIKALEAEVMRLKEIYQDTARERDTMVAEREAMAAEIRRLKDILASHGIGYESRMASLNPESAYATSSTTSQAGSSYHPGSASTGGTSPSHTYVGSSASPAKPPANMPSQGLNYDQIGIDFVLALERPCMDHMQFLMVQSQDSAEKISGHALMATCPPESHIAAHPDEPYPQKMPDIGMPDLVKLLDLSNRLPLDGEITPIMAWASIYSHPRRNELTAEDLASLQRDLLTKVTCYGFGAVLEEFEVTDALNAILTPLDTISYEDPNIAYGYAT